MIVRNRKSKKKAEHYIEGGLDVKPIPLNNSLYYNNLIAISLTIL